MADGIAAISTTSSHAAVPTEWQSMVTPEPWMKDALCAQVDGEMFFPEFGGSTREAKKICAACDVAQECLAYALRNDERFGIWGGLSERERRRLAAGSFEVKPSKVQAREARVRDLHAAGLMDTEIAEVIGATVPQVRNSRRLMGLGSNSRGGVPASSVIRMGERSRESRVSAYEGPKPALPKFVPPPVRPVPDVEDLVVEPVAVRLPEALVKVRPPRWTVKRLWVAVSPDGVLHGPFEDQAAGFGFVGDQLRPSPTPAIPEPPAAAEPDAGEKPKRAPRPRLVWTEQLDDLIRRRNGEHVSDAKIAVELGLGQPAVSARRRELGLPSLFRSPNQRGKGSAA